MKYSGDRPLFSSVCQGSKRREVQMRALGLGTALMALLYGSPVHAKMIIPS